MSPQPSQENQAPNSAPNSPPSDQPTGTPTQEQTPPAANGAPQAAAQLEAPAPTTQSLEPHQYAYVSLLEGNTLEETRAALEITTSKAKAHKAIELARKKFRTHAYADRDEITGWVLAALRDAYRKMLSVGDYQGAAKCLKMIQDVNLKREPVQELEIVM
jgi:hypothetical protein